MDFARPFTCVTPTVDGDVLAVLARTTRPLSVGQIHELAAAHSHSGIRKAVFRLVDTGVVERSPAGRLSVYTLNREHVAADWIVGLATITDRLWQRITDEVASWSEPAAAVVVFGSAARGQAGVESDLDICVVRPDELPVDDGEWREQLENLAGRATRWSGNDTRILELAAHELGGVGSLIEEVNRDGLMLVGDPRLFRRPVRHRVGA